MRTCNGCGSSSEDVKWAAGFQCAACKNAVSRARYKAAHGGKEPGRVRKVIGPCFPGYKMCAQCFEHLPLTSFHKGNARDGRAAWCADCCSLNKRTFTCLDCGKPATAERCGSCSRAHYVGPLAHTYKTGRTINKKGYALRSGFAGHPNATTNGVIQEHTLVMSESLGRALYPHENVHHVNGIKDDNRISNLELWSTSQPPGQRISDKLEWCLWFMGQYYDRVDIVE